VAKDQADWWPILYMSFTSQFVELIDDGGLADTKYLKTSTKLRSATGYNVVQAGEQGLSSRARPHIMVHPVKNPGNRTDGRVFLGVRSARIDCSSSACLNEVSATARVLTPEKASDQVQPRHGLEASRETGDSPIPSDRCRIVPANTMRNVGAKSSEIALQFARLFRYVADVDQLAHCRCNACKLFARASATG